MSRYFTYRGFESMQQDDWLDVFDRYGEDNWHFGSGAGHALYNGHLLCYSTLT